MTEAAKEARRAYYRAYYQRTKERQKQLKEEYWMRKAAKSEFESAKPKNEPQTDGETGC